MEVDPRWGDTRMTSAFFTLHQQLYREGPGEPADVAWAAKVAGLPADARICDVACGPGADIPALLEAAPEGKITAIDAQKHFIEELHMRIGADPRVMAYVGHLAKLKGPYDLIWCAGAVYFLGIEKALTAWRPALAKGGMVAFSEPCFFTDDPSEDARTFWEGYDTLDAAGIDAQIQKAGFQTVATRRISDAAWQAYYDPMAARIEMLRPDADAELTKVLDEGAEEIAAYNRVRDETGYLLSVVRPI